MSLVKRKNNKGFTLVELIIVVAIIAALAGVLAPQYLRYVDRAKEAVDIQVAASLMDAAVSAIIDPKNNVPSGYIIEVAWSTDPYHSKQGSLIVRSPVCVSSVYGRAGVTAKPIPANPAMFEALDKAISDILQADPSQLNSGITSDYYKPLIAKAESKVANEEDFIYHINTSTGAVVLSEESYRWIDEMGLNADK